MEEKAIPWWRRALKFALGGIRSGFGLFSRAVKAETETEAEFLESLQQRPEAETALTESIPQTEEVAVEATAAETLAEADPVDGPVVVHGPFEQEAAEVDRGPSSRLNRLRKNSMPDTLCIRARLQPCRKCNKKSMALAPRAFSANFTCTLEFVRSL